MHDFKITLYKKDYEGTITCKLKVVNGFILCRDLCIEVFGQGIKRFQKLTIHGRVDENEEIISTAVSRGDRNFAAGLGKVHCGADKTLTCIIIYDLVRQRNARRQIKYMHLVEMKRVDTFFDSATSTQF